MKKLLVLAIVLFAACKQTETTNTTTTMSTTETSATVATVAPDTAPATATMPPPTATGAIQTMGTNPAATRPPATTATTQTAPSTAAPANAPPPALVPKTPMPEKKPAAKTDTTPPPASATSAIETMGTNPNAPAASTPPPMIASEGSSVFKSHGCAMCHGAGGAGDTAMGKKNNIHDFRSAAVQSQSDADLAKTIRDGKGPVSASAHKSKALTGDQAKAVVAWIRSLQ